MIDRLIKQTNAPVLEKMLEFTAARHRVLAENVANLSTPGYRQKDLSLERFQSLLQRRVADGRPVDDVSAEISNPAGGVLFHDGSSRSVEQLMSDQAKNALMHNLVVELLRRQYQSMENALRERLG